MKLLRITKLDFRNSYEPVSSIPPSAKPVSGPHKVGDYVEMADNGYIRARYRKEEIKNDTSKSSSPVLFRGFSD